MKRRANGEGTAPKRRKDRDAFYVVVTVPASGLNPPRRRTIYGRTAGECVTKRNSFLADLDRGGPQPGQAPTIAQYGHIYLDQYLAAKVKLGQNRESTRSNYRTIWFAHVEPDLGHIRLDRLAPMDIVTWLASLTTRRSAHTGKLLTPTTQLRIFGVFRAALNRAYKDGLIRDNPIDRVDAPRGGRSEIKPLETEEITALLRAISDSQLETLLVLMLLTGARPGEALGASWSDIDLHAATWHISRTLTRTKLPGTSKSALAFTAPKTLRSDDVIALPSSAVEILQGQRLQQATARLAAPTWSDPDLVFATAIGTPLEARNVRRQLKLAAEKAGITRPIRLHDFRHATASALLAEGISMELTSKLLRHTRLDTTVDVYAHLTEPVRRAVADALDARYRRLHVPESATS